MGLGPVKYVVNSHEHNDHIRGNQVFKDAHIYSTQITRDNIEKNEPLEIADERKECPGLVLKYDSLLAAIPAKDTLQRREVEFWDTYYKTILESHKILTTVLPDKIVKGRETIKGSKQTVELIDLGMGHTASDLIVFIPSVKIIFTGDLLFINNHPWIADANLDSLKKCLYKIEAMNPAVLVPGHGPVGSKKDISELQNYLDYINQTAGELIKKGVEPDSVKDMPMPEIYQSWLFKNFYLPNIKFQMKKLLAQRDKINK
jgi:cyclase